MHRDALMSDVRGRETGGLMFILTESYVERQNHGQGKHEKQRSVSTANDLRKVIYYLLYIHKYVLAHPAVYSQIS